MVETDKRKNQKQSQTVSSSHINIQVPRSFTSLLCVILAVPYLVATGFYLAHNASAKTSSAKPETADKAQAAPPTSVSARQSANGDFEVLKPGPWGELRYNSIFIECPDEYLTVQADEKADRRWFFRGMTHDGFAQFLAAIPELSTEQRQQLMTAPVNAVANGIYLTPPKQVVLTLSPAARKKIYNVLTQFEENSWQREAYAFPASSFDSFFADSGLSTETLSLLKNLCYPHGRVLMFADAPYVLDTLPNYEQKLRFEKAISRRHTLLIRLHIDPTSDVNSLISYWGRAGTTKDLRPLLESVSKLPQGQSVNVALLFPPMPASRVYTYPFPSMNQPENCHWTSFNFFKDPPEGNYSDLKALRQKIDTEYYPVFSDPRYGDVVFLVKPNGDIVHSAVFVADDVVFTKNGGHFSAPWLLMRIPDLVDSYSTFTTEDQPLKVVSYRNKYY